MATDDDFDLGEYNDAFARAPEEDDRRGPDDDGNWPDDVKLEGEHDSLEGKIEMFNPKKKNGKKSFLWKLRITDGEHKGKVAWKESAVSPDAIEYLKKELAICGMRLGVTPGFNVLNDLPKKEIRKLLLGVVVVFKQAVVNGYNRVYVNKLVRSPGSSSQNAQQQQSARQAAPAQGAAKPAGGAMVFCTGCGEKVPGEKLNPDKRCEQCADMPF